MEKIVSKKLITSIPGIGVKYAQRLNAVGIKKPDDLLKQFEKLDKDPHRFVHWMKKECQAKTDHAKKTFDVVSGLIFDKKRNANDSDRKAYKEERENANGQKKYHITTPKLLLKAANVQNIASNRKTSEIGGQIKSSNGKDLQVSLTPLAASKIELDDQSRDVIMKKASTNRHSSNEDNECAKDALNQHLSKLRLQFSDMHDSANQKMFELQSELGKMQHMSHEFDVLAEFLTSEDKLSIFEQNLDRLQKTVHLTEEKVREINSNNQKMGRMIREINDTAKKQHQNNDKAILAMGERLERWELKLDRVARNITHRKIDLDNSKVNGASNLGQLKDDIEIVLNSRMAEVSKDMENMKNVVICIISLIFLKMFVFDLFKDDINGTLAELTKEKVALRHKMCLK